MQEDIHVNFQSRMRTSEIVWLEEEQQKSQLKFLA